MFKLDYFYEAYQSSVKAKSYASKTISFSIPNNMKLHETITLGRPQSDQVNFMQGYVSALKEYKDLVIFISYFL